MVTVLHVLRTSVVLNSSKRLVIDIIHFHATFVVLFYNTVPNAPLMTSVQDKTLDLYLNFIIFGCIYSFKYSLFVDMWNCEIPEL